MMLANAKEFFAHGVIVLFAIGLPAVGLVINIAGLQRRGLNRRAGVAACIFFGNLIVQGTTTSLTASDGIPEKVQLMLFAGTAIMNCLSALIALAAIWQMRSKDRWPRGKKRAYLVVAMNVCVLLALGTYFLFEINPAIYNRVMNG